MATTEPDRKAVDWLRANQEAVVKVLSAAQDELYATLGGQADPRRVREALAAEVARMRLTIGQRRKSQG
jgi:hypothetical protein